MAIGTPSISTLSRLAFVNIADMASSTAVPAIADYDLSAKEVEFLSESIKLTDSLTYNGGIRGTRSQVQDRVMLTGYTVGGTIEMNPTPAELDTLLPYILGTAESTDVFALSETLLGFGVLVDRIQKRFVYGVCYIDKATFKCSQGGLMTLSLDIIAQRETVTATAFPTAGSGITAISTQAPYIMAHASYVHPAEANATEVKEFTIVIDNKLMKDRFNNSLFITAAPPTDREISVQLVVPYTAQESALYGLSSAGTNACTITMTNGAASTLFTFGNLKTQNESPVVGSRGNEIMQTLNCRSYMATAGTKELVVTNDSTF